ncbi:YidB family protein [Streptomyces sp. NPDC005480]|uniref:YidB family protein n=1 Tax=Streptomyces sp. NPDC005480 TaxID=3154880 RepID=UPI0033AAEDAB
MRYASARATERRPHDGSDRTAGTQAQTTKGTEMAGTDLGSLLGSLLGRGTSSGTGNMLSTLLSSVGSDSSGSSIDGLLSQLKDGGLGAKSESWISDAENDPVSGAEIAQALPPGLLAAAAQAGGLSEIEAADQIAETLPVAVDKLTPEGKVPEGSIEEVIAQQL